MAAAAAAAAAAASEFDEHGTAVCRFFQDRKVLRKHTNQTEKVEQTNTDRESGSPARVPPGIPQFYLDE